MLVGMTRATSLFSGVTAFLVCTGFGCSVKPLTLQIDVLPHEAASVKTRLLKGDTAAQPSECTIPCSMTIAPETAHKLLVRAPGYFPAALELDYYQAARCHDAFGGDSVLLVVPLIKRPIAPEPTR